MEGLNSVPLSAACHLVSALVQPRQSTQREEPAPQAASKQGGQQGSSMASLGSQAVASVFACFPEGQRSQSACLNIQFSFAVPVKEALSRTCMRSSPRLMGW